MLLCLRRKSRLTMSVWRPSQSSNWRVALTTFIARQRYDERRAKSTEAQAKLPAVIPSPRSLRGMFHPQPQEPPAGLGRRIHIKVYDLHSITPFPNRNDIALRVPTPTKRITVQVNIGRHRKGVDRVEIR